jgi:hypothetical protein
MITTKLDEDALDLLREYKVKLKTGRKSLTLSGVIRLLVKEYDISHRKSTASKFRFTE